MAFAHVLLLSELKVVKRGPERKSELCPDPNETIDYSRNHEFPDEKVAI